MSDTPSGPNWWQASDGKWYPPETHPNYAQLPAPPPMRAPLAAPASATGASPITEPSKKPWWKRWWAIAIAVLVVIGIVGAIAGGGGGADDGDDSQSATSESTTSDKDEEAPDATADDTSSITEVEVSTSEPADTSAPATAAPQVGLSLAAPAQVGESVVVGDWTIRIAAVTPDAAQLIATENQFNEPPAPRKQFFMATLEATYTGSDSSTFWLDTSLKAIGASNVAYEGFEASCGVLPNDIDSAGEAFPGGTVSGNVCWSIDAGDAAAMIMIAEPSFSFDNDDRRFLSMDPTAVPLDDSTTKNAPTPQAIDGVPIGDPVQVGDWNIKVVGATPDAAAEIAAENQFNDPPAPGRQFFMATLEATYTGTESSTFWVDMSLKAVGASAVAYEGFDASCGVLPNDLDSVGETFPGGTITGNVCWSIEPADAGSLTMLASESFSFDDAREAFSLTR